ncbi:MAG: YybS family protein [Deltaproteobacteria bacterium]|nr:YybS family protein [Deltaproteobacteria bacterium]
MHHSAQGRISGDIAKGIAVITLMFAASVYVPFIGFVCAMLIPLPVLFYRSKLGRQAGLMISGLAIIVMIILLGNISFDLFLLIELMLLGFALSEIFEHDLSIEKTVLYSCCIVLFTGSIAVIFYCNMSDINLYNVVSEYVKQNLELTIALYEDMGLPEESLYVISSTVDTIQYILVRIIPALIVVSTLFVSWACILLSKPLLQAGKLFYPDFGSLNIWKAPEFLVWVVILSGVMLLLPYTYLKILGLNALIVLMSIYFFVGIAIISFLFEKKGFPRMLRFILYSIMAFQQIILILVIGLGFFDTWLNFRKLEIGES